LGKAPGTCRRRMERGIGPPRHRHLWAWQGRRWGCTRCGVAGTVRRVVGGLCSGPTLGRGDRSHMTRRATMNGVPLLVCMSCGGCRTGRQGLGSSCVVMKGNRSLLGRRLTRIGACLHPYSGVPFEWVKGSGWAWAESVPDCEGLLGGSPAAEGGSGPSAFHEDSPVVEPVEPDDWGDPLGLGTDLG
jgi:hypothetical protein